MPEKIRIDSYVLKKYIQNVIRLLTHRDINVN